MNKAQASSVTHPSDSAASDSSFSLHPSSLSKSDSSFILYPSSFVYYQLAHDYLVHSLRDWLTRKQRETRRGRAELRLAERAALWGDRREPKQLPTIREWLTIALLIPRHRWTQPEREVMKAASRRHISRAAVGFLVGVAALSAASVAYAYHYAHSLVERIRVAETSRVPELVAELGPIRQWANPALRAAANDASSSSRERLHAQLALLPAGLVKPESLVDPLLTAPPEEFKPILGMLLPYGPQLAGPLWTCVETADLDGVRRIRAACALAAFDPGNSAWQGVAPEVARLLLAENPLLVKEWVEIMLPVRRSIVGPLAELCAGLSDRGARSTRDQHPGRLLQRRPRAAR